MTPPMGDSEQASSLRRASPRWRISNATATEEGVDLATRGLYIIDIFLISGLVRMALFLMGVIFPTVTNLENR